MFTTLGIQDGRKMLHTYIMIFGQTVIIFIFTLKLEWVFVLMWNFNYSTEFLVWMWNKSDVIFLDAQKHANNYKWLL